MKRDTINYFVVGVFVLILFSAFIVIMYKITGSTGPTDRYYVSYNNVAGIKYGTPVLYEGYQIGQVELVEPVREGGAMQFKLSLSVIEGWSIPEDSIAQIVKSGLLSAVAINIEEGESEQSLSPDAFLQGQEATDIFSAVNDVAADIQELTRESLRPLLDNMNEQVGLISADFRSLANDSVKSLINTDLKSLLGKLSDSADGLLNVLSVDNLQNIEQLLSNLDVASSDFVGLLKDLEDSRMSLNVLLANLDKFVDENNADIRSGVKDLQKTLYVVSRHIEAVAHHMEGSSRNMQEFTRQIRENPGSLLRGTPQQEIGGNE